MTLKFLSRRGGLEFLFPKRKVLSPGAGYIPAKVTYRKADFRVQVGRYILKDYGVSESASKSTRKRDR